MTMKLQLATVLTALAISSNVLPVYAVSTDRLPEATVHPQDNAVSYDQETYVTPDHVTLPSQSDAALYESSLPKAEGTVSSGDPSPSLVGDPDRGQPAAGTDGHGTGTPDEAPTFSARIEYFGGQGYLARGTFTEFLPNTSLVQPLYSLDGEVWQPCQTAWNLQWLGKDTPEDRKALQNQTCLFGAHEPLAGYLAGDLNRFYLKLQITLENGTTYETQAAVIDRGDPRPVPEELTPIADFASAMRVRQWRPFKSHGQYQITVSADATSEEISALLPDTLPIQVYLYAGINTVTDAVIDCPVTWKSLSPSRLTPGESVVIENAAEEILVPAGTLLNTPTGVFRLNEPLGFDHDEVKLILNVVEKNAEPTGTLRDQSTGLEISFDLKPTGATAIRAYTLSEGDAAWTEIPTPLMPEKVNTPSSTASSLFTFVLTAGQEPYHSWLSAWDAGIEPRPFLVGLKIEGGVYDGRQLILAYPDTYEIPIQPPAITGSGGNEGNAGSDNKNDSTPEGQRPNLPQNTGDKTDTQKPQGTEPTQKPDDTQNSQGTGSSQKPDDMQNPQGTEPTLKPDDTQNSQGTGITQKPDDMQNPQGTEPTLKPDDTQNSQGTGITQKPDDMQDPDGTELTQETGLTPESGNGQVFQASKPTQGTDNVHASQKPRPTQAPESEQNTLEKEPDPSQLISVKPKDSLTNLIQPFKESTGTPEWIPSDAGAAGSPAWEEENDLTGHGLQWFFPAIAVTAASGICIITAVGKATAGSISIRLSGKILRALHHFLHLK